MGSFAIKLKSERDEARASAEALLKLLDEALLDRDILKDAMRRIIAIDESDKFGKWNDTQYQIRRIAERAVTGKEYAGP